MAVATLTNKGANGMFRKLDYYFFEGQGNLQDRLFFYGSTTIIFLIGFFILLAI